MRRIRKILTVFLACSSFAFLNAAPDLVPMPKSYKETGGNFQADGKNVFIEKNNRQCKIAFEELDKKNKDLSGLPLKLIDAKDISFPGIYILTVNDPLAEEFRKKYQFEISTEKPGAQGYVIKVASEQAVIIGSDNIGALYGAVTFSQMMKKQDGKNTVASCDVTDWPDFKFRSAISYMRGLSQLANGEKSKEAEIAAYKAGIDIMLRFKMNTVFDYIYSRVNVWSMDDDWRKTVAEINKYAVERGIYPSHYDTTAIENCRKENFTEKLKNWKCVKESRGGKYSFYCWSDDKAQREKIEKVAEFYKQCNFRMVYIHPVDGGAIEDPEMWSHRCSECRKLWKDDERWKATVHQLNMWADIFKEKAPGIELESPMYPYSAAYAIRERFPNVSTELWKQNSIDYWTNVNKELSPAIRTGSWMANRGAMDKYRKCWDGRAMRICDHFPLDAGIFSTYYRYIISNFYNNPRDLYLARGTSVYGNWLTLISCCEFAWNTSAPGNEEFKGLFYDPEKDHTGPAVIIDEWAPRACRILYGEKVGGIIAKMYQSGLQPLYILEPGKALDRANKSRRKPLADVDPNSVSKNSDTGRIAPDIVDSAARMEFQVNAAEKSLAALDNAWKYYDTMDKYQKKMFIYYYKRVPLLYTCARANYADRVAGDLQENGMFEDAARVLDEALKNFNKDSAKINKINERIKNETDLMPPDKLKYGTFPKLSEIKEMLETRLADAKVVLKPRRPGRVVNVAVYDGSGAKGTMEFLGQFKNVNAELIKTLNLSVLDKYDCVLVMSNKNINQNDFMNSLRRYVVEGGGGALLEHSMIGGPKGPLGDKNPFPEVCKTGGDRKDGKKVKAVIEHPVMKGLAKNTESSIMYVDWFVAVPGDKGTVLAADAAGNAVVVAGTIGNGKVVCSGTISISSIGGGYDAEEKLLYGFNAAVVEGSVEWFTGVKLEKK